MGNFEFISASVDPKETYKAETLEAQRQLALDRAMSELKTALIKNKKENYHNDSYIDALQDKSVSPNFYFNEREKNLWLVNLDDLTSYEGTLRYNSELNPSLKKVFGSETRVAKMDSASMEKFLKQLRESDPQAFQCLIEKLADETTNYQPSPSLSEQYKIGKEKLFKGRNFWEY